MRIILLAALILSCGPRSGHFQTKCGMIYKGYFNSEEVGEFWNEQRLQQTEDEWLLAMTKTTDPRLNSMDKACAALKDLYVWVQPHQACWDYHGEKICGQTSCENNQVLIGDLYFYASALPHEMVHIAQNCHTPAPADTLRDAYHGNWDRDGIYKAIDTIGTALAADYENSFK